MLLTRIKVVCVVLCLCFREPWNTSDVTAVLHGELAHLGLIRSVNDANLMFENLQAKRLLQGNFAFSYKNVVFQETFAFHNHFFAIFLWRGLDIDADNNVVMRDQEIASMRQGRAFLSLINDSIPKTVSAMEKLLAMLEEQDKSFPQARFETLILGTIYSAYQARNQRLESEQQAWVDILGRFANVTFVQLRKS